MVPTIAAHHASNVQLPIESSTAFVPTQPDRLRRLILEHHDFLWRGLRRLGVPASEVDDALQTVFVTVNRKLDEIETGRERSYLFGIAIRVASNARRAESRKRKVFDEHPFDEDRATHDVGDMVELRDLLEQALASMSFELRTAFVLYEMEEMTAPEIAAVLEVPVGTVASRLRRARAHFSTRAAELRASLESEDDE